MLMLPAVASGTPTPNQIHHCDALTLLRALPDASIDLAVYDFPYMGVKEDAWDNQWKTVADYIAWLQPILAQTKRVLKPNGSFYGFASPQMSARVEIAVQGHFNVLNNIRWIKEAGWHNKTEKEAIRSYLSPWEAVIFAEKDVSEDGFTQADGALHSRIFEPLRAYFESEQRRLNLTYHDINSALGTATGGGGMASHYFKPKGLHYWQLPTAEQYRKLQTLGLDRDYSFLCREYEELRREYEELRREYEELRREYEELRRPFYMTDRMAYTDDWHFAPVKPYPGKHPCEKPLAMMEHIIKVSSRPGAVVLDCFAGSGATLDAARRLGRSYIGCDMDAGYVQKARARLATPYMVSMFNLLPAKTEIEPVAAPVQMAMSL